MHCPRCRVQVAATLPDATCPYCGGPAEESKRLEASPEAEGIPGTALAPLEADRTRTELGDREAWLPGTVLAGKYEVLSRLGSGGFGTVYKVRHVFRKKYYALKTPHPELARDPVFCRRFEREIEAMERFVHPDVVLIRDSGVTEDGRPYYTMDFIEGESLKAVIRREGRLPLDRVLTIVGRILKVLEAAHAQQIVHRDVKPDNILLARVQGRESVKVLDFGVAKLLDLVGDSSSITRGARVGTPKYMSPEQITGEAVDARSDLFSLGIVFYEMLAGAHPFSQIRDPIRVTASILNRDPGPLEQYVRDVPARVNEIVLGMLEKKPRRRPASATVLLEQLSELLAPLEATDPEPATLRLVPGVPRRLAGPLVLRQGTEDGERRIFLSFEETLRFGRSNEPQKGIANHFLWRCLPCRSQAQDAGNWQKNLTISHAVGALRPEGHAVWVEPAPGSKQGVVVGGVRSFEAVRLTADRFHLALGDRALELDGYRALRGDGDLTLDLRFLAQGRPEGAGPRARMGYSNDACRIDSVSVLRPINHPLHEYHLVCRLLRLGSAAEAAVRLAGSGVEGSHAAVIHDAGECFLLALEPGVRVRGLPPSASATGEIELAPSTLLPLGPGLEIILGTSCLRVDATDEADFKTVD